ncbi:MAG: hypothetical protein HZB76_01860 [Chlamydiae bacterium]|nr:hypothetical protein [Chlamydiota bacterium]
MEIFFPHLRPVDWNELGGEAKSEKQIRDTGAGVVVTRAGVFPITRVVQTALASVKAVAEAQVDPVR